MNPTYIVGLGGAGLRTGLEIKKIVTQSNVQNFAFRFIDTDKEESMASNNYHEIFHRKELTIIGEFDLQYEVQYYTKLKDADFESWFDRTITFSPWGNNMDKMGTRQIGRLACFINYQKIFAEIQADINLLSYNTGTPINNIDVLIITSTCGGTGSGIYFDIAAIICNILGSSQKIQAAFILPHVYFNLPFPEETENMKSNTWAFLKEIDFFMNDPHTPRKLMAEYSCKKSVYENSSRVDFAPFNNANLFCNITSEGRVIKPDAFFIAVAAGLCKYIGILPLTSLQNEFDMVIYNFNMGWQSEIPNSNELQRAYNETKFHTPHIVRKWNDDNTFKKHL